MNNNFQLRFSISNKKTANYCKRVETSLVAVANEDATVKKATSIVLLGS